MQFTFAQISLLRTERSLSAAQKRTCTNSPGVRGVGLVELAAFITVILSRVYVNFTLHVNSQPSLLG